MDNSTILLMPPLLLMQQISTTVSTRAKTSESVTYCAIASFAAHFSWVVSNAFALWKVGKEFDSGVTTSGLVAILWYASWATLGNIIGQRAAIYFEKWMDSPGRGQAAWTVLHHGFKVGQLFVVNNSNWVVRVSAITSEHSFMARRLNRLEVLWFRFVDRVTTNWGYLQAPFRSWRTK